MHRSSEPFTNQYAKFYLEEVHHVFALVGEVSGHRQRHVAADAHEVYRLVLPHDGVDSGVLRLGVVFQPLRNLCWLHVGLHTVRREQIGDGPLPSMGSGRVTHHDVQRCGCFRGKYC